MTVGGLSLVARAVSCAYAAGIFDDIVMSTDDPEVADEGLRAGARAPFLRPAQLATDQANIRDAVIHLLEHLAKDCVEAFDIAVLLEPTSPARTPDVIRKTVATCASEGCDAAFTVTEVSLKHHPMKQFRMTEDGFAAFAHPDGATIINRQELMPTYIRNGICYAVRTTSLTQGYGLIGSAARLVPVDGPVINIDDQADLDLARRALGP